jgi:hypothetical protein
MWNRPTRLNIAFLLAIRTLHLAVLVRGSTESDEGRRSFAKKLRPRIASPCRCESPT